MSSAKQANNLIFSFCTDFLWNGCHILDVLKFSRNIKGTEQKSVFTSKRSDAFFPYFLCFMAYDEFVSFLTMNLIFVPVTMTAVVVHFFCPYLLFPLHGCVAIYISTDNYGTAKFVFFSSRKLVLYNTTSKAYCIILFFSVEHPIDKLTFIILTFCIVDDID